MRGFKGVWVIIALVSFCLALPLSASADSIKEDECLDKKDPDLINLCRAKPKESKDNTGKNRYQNKDHSTYYCTLIKKRDLQAYCFAIVNSNKTQCGNIVDKKIEEECNASFK